MAEKKETKEQLYKFVLNKAKCNFFTLKNGTSVRLNNTRAELTREDVIDNFAALKQECLIYAGAGTSPILDETIIKEATEVAKKNLNDLVAVGSLEQQIKETEEKIKKEMQSLIEENAKLKKEIKEKDAKINDLKLEYSILEKKLKEMPVE